MKYSLHFGLFFVLFVACSSFSPTKIGNSQALMSSGERIRPRDVELTVTIPDATTLTQEGTSTPHKVWLQMINEAKETIDMGEFYLSNKPGEILEPIIQALIKAADRGVRIRILTDIVMTAVSQDTINRLKDIPGIEVQIFDWQEFTGILHAKYFIIDRSEVFVGSQNFDWRALKHIYETGLRIKNRSIALGFDAIFEADWKFAKGEKPADEKMQLTGLKFPKELYPVVSPENAGPAGFKSAIKELLKLIRNAKQKITIQLLHYSLRRYNSKELFKDIDHALRNAALRGVKINMLVSDWSKKKPNVDFLKDLSTVKNITIKFVTFPEHPQGFIPFARVLHSKVMRIDDRTSWIGTSNWEYDYFYNSRNIEIVSTLIPLAKKLDVLFARLWNSEYAHEIDPNEEYLPPITH